EPGESEGVEPGGAWCAVPVVHRTRGCVLAGDRVLRVEAPESPVLARPRCRLVDEVRRPRVRLTGADREAVASRKVDEGDTERITLLVTLAERGPPKAAKGAGKHPRSVRCRNGHFCLVLASLEVGRMRPGPRIDD